MQIESWNDLEKWCRSCDTSSREEPGEYKNYIWTCHKCIKNMKYSNRLNQSQVTKRVRDIIKTLDESIKEH